MKTVISSPSGRCFQNIDCDIVTLSNICELKFLCNKNSQTTSTPTMIMNINIFQLQAQQKMDWVFSKLYYTLF